MSPILDLYSSRQAKADSAADVWSYDQIPSRLRVQVSNIVSGALGTDDNAAAIYEYVSREVAHEHGIAGLARQQGKPFAEVHDCLRASQNTLLWLDVVELCLRLIERYCGRYDQHQRRERGITIPSANAVEELNERFRRAGFGYRYESGKIIRIDSEFLHQEITRPALELLSDPRFAGANEEFRAAHDHLKAGENKDCAVDALNALESTMKAICDAKGWKYDKGAGASDLLKVLHRRNLFPDFADQSFEQLVATLKWGLPAVRNEAGGDGQGSVPVEVPTYVAVYALNLAASKIRLLVDAFNKSEGDAGSP
jgi:HEPN domain-containing protein